MARTQAAARRRDADREHAVGVALDAIRRLEQELRVSNRAVEQALGLSGAQLFVLEELAREPASSLNELAARTHTRHSSVSTVVTRLVESGLVLRRASKEDARRTELAVSARARRLLEQSPPSAQARLLSAARTLPPAQLAELGAALTAWCNAFVSDAETSTTGRRPGRLRVSRGSRKG